jgi:hypothetical protein
VNKQAKWRRKREGSDADPVAGGWRSTPFVFAELRGTDAIIHAAHAGAWPMPSVRVAGGRAKDHLTRRSASSSRQERGSRVGQLHKVLPTPARRRTIPNQLPGGTEFVLRGEEGADRAVSRREKVRVDRSIECAIGRGGNGGIRASSL